MRASILYLLLVGCGDGEGLVGQHCAIDGDCEKGLSCQDRGPKNVCEPDGTKGCKSDDECPTGSVCFPEGTGTFCQPGAIVDASTQETVD